MSADAASNIARRDFLKLASAATACGLAPVSLAAGTNRICLILDPENPTASSAPVKRAAEKLRQALASKGVGCRMEQAAEAAPGSSLALSLLHRNRSSLEHFLTARLSRYLRAYVCRLEKSAEFRQF